jgi:putative OPT family oligopeptide transporter
MAEESLVPPEPARKPPPELTIKAVLLGCVLAVLMAAANTYLGLYTGMVVSASIPAAVISMGILRGILRRGTLLENNIVQTIASAGESLAAGIIFTVPALVITGAWNEFKFCETTLIAILGGLLGVLFMIPLRRTLIVEEEELKYPEGVACAEVLEAGQQGGSGILYVFSALGVGALLKLLGQHGIGLLKGTVQGATRAGRSALYFGCDVSPALLAVGYIVGFNVALLVFLGGAIGWLLGIPIYYLLCGFPTGAESVTDAMHDTWESQIRYMGVGAMVVGGVWSIIGVRRGIVKGIRGAIAGYQDARAGKFAPRVQRDLSLFSILGLLLPTIVAVYLLYAFVLIGSPGFGLLASAAMIVAAFFFVAVSSYVVGLVGASNNPVSGMTISTLLFACGLLWLFGLGGNLGIIAALGVAGVVCCAACTAGDVSQDLKTGYLVRATPYKQQWAQVIGVLAASFVIAPVLGVLHASYGIGVETREGVDFLKAPQASLFASITRAMFDPEASMPWTMVGVGLAVGVAIICLDECLRRRGSGFRTHVMPVAVGIYLPWSLGVPIFIGGLAALITGRIVGKSREKEAVHRGVLIGSGLIAGEALMGILIALFIFFTQKMFEMELPATARIPELLSNLLSVLLLAAVIAGMVLVAVRGRPQPPADG